MKELIPPQALEAEQSTLGSLMIAEEAYYAVKDIGLKGSDFYREAHGIIFSALAGMYEAKEHVDIITLQEDLRRTKQLVPVGGTEYLMTLIDMVPSASNARHYGKIVKDQAVRRQYIDLARQLHDAAHDGAVQLDSLATMVSRGEMSISQQLIVGKWVPYASVIPEVIAEIGDAYRSGTSLKGISSGLPALDALTCGWQNKDLVLIAARPSVGKTALMLQLAEQAAMTGSPVAIFSLEMDRRQLGIRSIQAVSGMSGYALRDPKFGEEGWKRLVQAAGPVGKFPIYIDDEATISHSQIFTKARRAVREHGVKLLMLDYLQLVDGPATEGRNREIGAITRVMRTAAKSLNVPFIALSQLSRRCEQEGNRRPKLSDLRDSGEIEQEINVCIFIHPTGKSEQGKDQLMELVVAKNRQLSCGVLPVRWVPKTMRFHPVVP